MENISMRDAFFNSLFEIARLDRDIFVITADMGAPSLDKFRKELPRQFINVGIAEQNMITVAAGLSLCGKKVFVYAIMPFATLRCVEMIKVDLSLMRLPITVIGVGAGFSYDDSGPTHHSTEDLSIMRAFPHMTILNASDSLMASRFARMACEIAGPSYVRLDRGIFPNIYGETDDFSRGFSVLKNGMGLWILATGNMVHRALEVAQDLESYSIMAGVIDVYRLKPVESEALLAVIRDAEGIVTLEEHLLAGGLGSIVAELLVDNEIRVPLKRIGIQDKYFYAYGGRENIQSLCGLSRDKVGDSILKWRGTKISYQPKMKATSLCA